MKMFKESFYERGFYVRSVSLFTYSIDIGGLSFDSDNAPFTHNKKLNHPKKNFSNQLIKTRKQFQIDSEKLTPRPRQRNSQKFNTDIRKKKSTFYFHSNMIIITLYIF